MPSEIEFHAENPFDKGASDRPIGMWVSIIANIVGASAGGVFFLARPGGRFRGMEPEAGTFVILSLIAASLGLFFGMPLSIRDIWRRRMWISGILGVLLAFTPLFTAVFVSDLAAWYLGLIWD